MYFRCPEGGPIFPILTSTQSGVGIFQRTISSLQIKIADDYSNAHSVTSSNKPTVYIKRYLLQPTRGAGSYSHRVSMMSVVLAECGVRWKLPWPHLLMQCKALSCWPHHYTVSINAHSRKARTPRMQDAQSPRRPCSEEAADQAVWSDIDTKRMARSTSATAANSTRTGRVGDTGRVGGQKVYLPGLCLTALAGFQHVSKDDSLGLNTKRTPSDYPSD